MPTVSLDVIISKKDRVEIHLAGCQAAQRNVADVIERSREVEVEDFISARADCRAEAKALNEAGTYYHRCLDGVKS